MKIIDANEVPKKVGEKKPWRDIFRKIPDGKAMMFEAGEAHPSTVRTQLQEFHKKGEFMSLSMTTRKSGDKGYIIYVTNISKVDSTKSK